jgi:hypothetical protein
MRLLRCDRCGTLGRDDNRNGWVALAASGRPPCECWYAGPDDSDMLDVCPDCITPEENVDCVLLEVMLDAESAERREGR